MTGQDEFSTRAETDASLRTERVNTDEELARRAAATDADARQVLRIARERADRLLAAARAAGDARLPLSEQTEAAVALLLDERKTEDRLISAEREQADEVVDREKRARREKLKTLLVLEREATDLHLAVERRSADRAILARDDFLAQASHDLRGLMAANKLCLSLLARSAGDGEHGRSLAPRIAALVQIDAQLDRLVNDLVDMVAIEAGKLAVAPSAHAAAELLSTAIAVFEPLASERGQSLVVTSKPADVLVMADAARTVQVLGNLLSNAIKFTPSGGEVRVGFEAPRDEVIFFVADTGPGVPAEQASRIFERFVGTSTSSGGLGLGLFIASRLVEAHGGRLWLDSEPGQSAVFRFMLARAEPAVAR